MKKSFKKKIANMFEPIIYALNWPFAKLSGKSQDMEKAFLWPVIKSYSKNSKINIIQYCSFPKNVDGIETESLNQDFSDYAIILQGPITDVNFTANTVRLYLNCYPKVKIIISTWNDLSEQTRSRLLELNIVLLENDAPLVAGAGNINKQLVSSYEGMRKAEELQCLYSVKTRTDQRVYANDMLKYFKNLTDAFPSNNRKIVNKRLVFISYGKSYRYLPFNLCDFIVFGETSELIKLYGVERDTRDLDYHNAFSKDEKAFNRVFFDKLEKKADVSPYTFFPNFAEQYYRYMYAEYYIVYKYFTENINKLNKDTDLLDAYYYYLKNYAVVADSEKLLVYWPKYATNQVKNETELDFLSKLDFKKWLDIYLHFESKKDWS